MGFKPLHDRVVVSRFAEETKTAGGIIARRPSGPRPKESPRRRRGGPPQRAATEDRHSICNRGGHSICTEPGTGKPVAGFEKREDRTVRARASGQGQGAERELFLI